MVILCSQIFHRLTHYFIQPSAWFELHTYVRFPSVVRQCDSRRVVISEPQVVHEGCVFNVELRNNMQPSCTDRTFADYCKNTVVMVPCSLQAVTSIQFRSTCEYWCACSWTWSNAGMYKAVCVLFEKIHHYPTLILLLHWLQRWPTGLTLSNKL